MAKPDHEALRHQLFLCLNGDPDDSIAKRLGSSEFTYDLIDCIDGLAVASLVGIRGYRISAPTNHKLFYYDDHHQSGEASENSGPL